MKKDRINNMLKVLYILISICLIIPSVMYLISNKTVLMFDTYFNFFINRDLNKIVSTLIYIFLLLIMSIVYFIFIKRNSFKNIKQLIIFICIISTIFIFLLPFTSSDVFYYMGVGELNSVYNQNPYYVSITEYCNEKDINDSILEQGAINPWADTVVVYGPMAQIFFSLCTKLSFKNVDICLIIFKLANIVFHVLNCYLIYKITRKLKFSVMYGLNPFMYIEFIGNCHNDIIVVFFILLSLYFLLKKKSLLKSVIFLSIATGIKYFAILLLPVIILYYYRKENILKKIVKCILYLLIFLRSINFTIYSFF